jgi:dTDP-4-dehydrorhamnose reductase
MTWLVVGGNGQLGKALSLVLGEGGIEFRALGSDELDIRSELKCSSYIGELKPSVVINAAAWTDVDGAESDPDGAHEVNAVGPLNLAVAAGAVGAVFVQVSTDYVFSGVSSRPWQEDDLRVPVSVYGTTKAAGEVAVLGAYAESSYIFRTAWLYSPWGKNFAKTMTRLALSGDGEVRVVNDQVGQPTSALDLANQIVDSVIAKVPFGIYHATNSGEGSWCDFAREVFEFSGASVPRVVPVSSSEFVRPAKRPAYSVLGHDRWREIEPMRDWRIALREAMPAIVASTKSEIAAG